MKVKRVRSGSRAWRSAMDDFVRTAEAVKRGERRRRETGVYFTSMEAFRKP